MNPAIRPRRFFCFHARTMRVRSLAASALAAVTLGAAPVTASTIGFDVINLASNQSGAALSTDPG